MADGQAFEREMISAARRILSGDYQMPAGRETRAAALLARTSLEHAVSRRVGELSGVQITTTNTRACHEHAYELAPTHQEVDHLITKVADCLRSLVRGPQTVAGTSP